MPSELRALLVDDEPLARRRLRQLCARALGVRVVGEAGDGVEALAAVAEHTPDLLFLDIQMPAPGGLAVLEALADTSTPPPLVVLVTAHRAFAVEAFALGAVDYLLKPFDADRFHDAIERVRERLRVRSAPLPAAPATRLAVRDGLRIRFVELADLEHITAEGNYVTLHVGEQESLVRETMAAMEAKLDPACFVRIHRGIIVRVDRVVEIEPVASGEYVVCLRSGARVTSGRSYKKQITATFGL